MKNEDHIATFILYSTIVYPITNYIVSPSRGYSKWRGICYAVLFLAAVAFIQLSYDISEKESNFYSLLSVWRDSTVTELRRGYKRLSLELHPDKNRSPEAAALYQQVKAAYEVLNNPEGRSVYDRFGIDGIRALAHGVVDAKFTIVHLLIKYASSLFFTFMMTMSDSTGDVAVTCVVTLSAILYLDLLVVSDRAVLPAWLFPGFAPFELVGILHKLYPGFMNGWRCISSSLRAPARSTAPIEGVQHALSTAADRIVSLSRKVLKTLNSEEREPESLVVTGLKRSEERVSYSRTSQKEMSDMNLQLEFYRANLAFSRPTLWERYFWVVNIAVYLVLWTFYRMYIINTTVNIG